MHISQPSQVNIPVVMMHADGEKNIIQSIYRNPSISTIRNTSFKYNKFMVIVTSEILIYGIHFINMLSVLCKGEKLL